jgi:cellulose synthase operon protein C
VRALASLLASVISANHANVAAGDDPYAARLESLKVDAIAHAHDPSLALTLYQASALKDDLASLVPLAELFAKYADRRNIDADARTAARMLLADLERTRGRAPRAAEQMARLGFVDSFMVLGPFDNEAKAGCDKPRPADRGADPNAHYEGKVREVRWRRIALLSSDGYIDLGAMLRPTSEVVAYAEAYLDVRKDTRAVLHVGTSGASRLFVNDTRVIVDDAYHQPRPDQSAVAVNLHTGSNRVLLKLCESEGPLGFYLRVTDSNGEVSPDVAVVDPATYWQRPPPPIAKGRPLAVAPEKVPTLVDKLKQRAEAHKDDARVWGDYAESLLLRRSFDTKDKLAAVESAKAARRKPDDVRLNLLAARAEEDDANVRRAFLEAAVTAAGVTPTDLAPALELAHFQSAHGHPERAIALLRALPSGSNRWFEVGLGVADAEEELGMFPSWVRDVDALAATFPDRPPVIREWARVARRLDRPRDAASRYRVALSLRYDDEQSRRPLIGLLVDFGDIAGALAELEVSSQLDPVDIGTLTREADLAAANGDFDRARKLFTRAESLCPDEPDVREREGKALLRAGDRSGAIKAFIEALRLKPQNASLHEALRALQGSEAAFGEAYAADARGLAAHAPPAPGEDAVILNDLTAVKVFPSGLSSRFEQLVVRVFTDRGVESYRTHYVSYAPDRQEAKIVRARVIKPDGSTIESYSESERSLSEPWAGIHYDARARIITLPALAPGDTLELVQRVDDVASDNLLSDYYGDIASVQATDPNRHFEYLLVAPAGRKIYSNDLSAAGVKRTESDAGGGDRLYRWEATGVPKVVPEPSMPGWSEVATMLHVSTFRDWESVGRFYWGLVRDQLAPDDSVREAVKEALMSAKGDDDRAKIRAIYDYVVTKTRYVGLEFGVHSYKPYAVAKVLARRYGDCKDKASLIVSMLKVAGIDARIVLLRMRRLGRIGPEPASLAVFNHAIAYVPKYDLYLDGTAEEHGSSELPSEDRGASVLIVVPDGNSRFTTTPYGVATNNVTASEFKVQISDDGTAQIDGTSVVTGVAAAEYRSAYESPGSRRAVFEEAWSRTFPGLRVQNVTTSDLSQLEKDVHLDFSLRVPQFAHLESGGMSFTPFGQMRPYVESYAPLSKRRYDLEVGYPWVNRFRHTYTLPAQWAPGDLPKPVELRSPFGHVRLAYRVEGSNLIAEGEVGIDTSLVAAKDYAAFRSFLSDADAAIQRRVPLVKAQVGAGRAGTNRQSP